jgi:hypothetical protein
MPRRGQLRNHFHSDTMAQQAQPVEIESLSPQEIDYIRKSIDEVGLPVAFCTSTVQFFWQHFYSPFSRLIEDSY